MKFFRHLAVIAAGAVVASSLAGCGLRIPTDPGGTLEGLAGGTMRVGYSPEPGLVEEGLSQPEGPLAELVEQFADELDAKVEWSMHGEESMVKQLESDELDLGVGEFSEDTPWVDRVGVTRGYPSLSGSGDTKFVMLVPPGENAFISRLESFLDQEVAS